MEGFTELVNLRRLYLEKNKISRLEGLENCRRLEELSLGNQDTNCEFTFDDYSLAALGGCLRVLEIPNSKLVQVQ